MPGFDLKLVDDPVVLGKGSFLEGGFGGCEKAARISHRGIEHQLVEVVSQVVVQGNVLAASLDCIFLTQGITPAGDLVQKSRPSAFHAVHHFLILQKEAEQQNQIVGRPVAGRVTVRHPERASEAGFSEEVLVFHDEFGLEAFSLPKGMSLRGRLDTQRSA